MSSTSSFSLSSDEHNHSSMMSSSFPAIRGLDDDEGSEQVITLVCKGGEKLLLSKKAAMHSEVLKQALEEDPNATEIPAIKEYSAMSPIVSFLEKLQEHGTFTIEYKVLDAKGIDGIAPDWAIEFINQRSKLEVVSLFVEATYYNIDPLLRLLGAKLATYIRGKDGKQLNHLFKEELGQTGTMGTPEYIDQKIPTPV